MMNVCACSWCRALKQAEIEAQAEVRESPRRGATFVLKSNPHRFVRSHAQIKRTEEDAQKKQQQEEAQQQEEKQPQTAEEIWRENQLKIEEQQRQLMQQRLKYGFLLTGGFFALPAHVSLFVMATEKSNDSSRFSGELRRKRSGAGSRSKC